MTVQQKSAIRVGVITTVIGSLLVLAFSKAASQVVLRPEIEALESRLERKVDAVKDIALDNLCDTNPTHWRCK